MNVAWQTLVNASSNISHTIIQHTTRATSTEWIENATEAMTKLSKIVLMTCIISSPTPKALHANKHTFAMSRGWKKTNHCDVTSSTAESFSIGRLQAVSENCCQFLYSLICFHFCMQVSRIDNVSCMQSLPLFSSHQHVLSVARKQRCLTNCGVN